MAKRIRWDWIEAQYRVGLQIRAISRLHEDKFGIAVHESSIRKRRDQCGWKVDLTDAVAAERIRIKNAQAELKSTQSTQESTHLTREEVVAEAALRTATVLGEHQKVLQQIRMQCSDLLSFNNVIIATLKEEQQLSSLLRDSDETLEQKKHRVSTTMRMVGTLNANIATSARAASIYVPLERISHGIAVEAGPGDGMILPDSPEAEMIVVLAAQEIENRRCS